MMVALAVLLSAEVIATAGPASRPRVSALGARRVVDYHNSDRPGLLADGQLEIPGAARYRLADAAQALAQATGGHAAGAIILMP